MIFAFGSIAALSWRDARIVRVLVRAQWECPQLLIDAPNEVKATLLSLLCRVEIKPERVEINISRERLGALLAGQSIDLTMPDKKLDNEFGIEPVSVLSN